MKRALALVGVVVLGVLGVVGWRSARSDAPPPLTVDDAAATSAGTGQGSSSGDLDGRWQVVAGPGTVAGLRIEEDRSVALGDHTAVGRTGRVRGGVEVADGAVAAGSFTVDLSAIEFTDDPGLPVANRATYLRTHAIETDRYPTARFELDGPIRLPRFTDGAARRVRVSGVLELHGVARPMEVLVDVRRAGGRVVLGTSAPVGVRLADHDIERPEIPGLSKVAEEGSFELVVVLERR